MHRDGSTRWFLTRGSAVALDGRPVRIIGIDIDITERKTSEQAFASTLAHEVRQPLTAIIMNARSCLRRIAGETPDPLRFGPGCSMWSMPASVPRR